MREVICINMGQCGIQMSNAAWELLCVEHGIEANGKLKFNLIDDDSIAFKCFFEEIKNKNQFVPRCVSVDLEPSVIDEVRRGPYRGLFHPNNLLNALPDGANNFARGLFTIGKTIMPQVKEAIRKNVELCDMLQGFFLLHSCGGGTGSGFSTLMLDNLNLDYAKRTKFQMHIFQSPVLSCSTVEPYNAMLAASKAMETCEMSNLIDNESLYNICLNNLEIERPTYTHINRLIARLFSDITVSLRFESSLNSDLDQLSTNLIPFPRIHYPIASFAPINSQSRAVHELWTTNQLTRDLFETFNRFATCDPPKGRYICCVLQYRGDISHQEINQAVVEIKKRRDIRFVNWVPTGFKIGVNVQPPTAVGNIMATSTRSATMLSNATSAKDCFKACQKRFDVLFSKRSFIHWYVGEGMEEGEFNEARDDVENITKDYEEIEASEDEYDEEEEERKREEGGKQGGGGGRSQTKSQDAGGGGGGMDDDFGGGGGGEGEDDGFGGGAPPDDGGAPPPEDGGTPPPEEGGMPPPADGENPPPPEEVITSEDPLPPDDGPMPLPDEGINYDDPVE